MDPSNSDTRNVFPLLIVMIGGPTVTWRAIETSLIYNISVASLSGSDPPRVMPSASRLYARLGLNCFPHSMSRRCVLRMGEAAWVSRSISHSRQSLESHPQKLEPDPPAL